MSAHIGARDDCLEYCGRWNDGPLTPGRRGDVRACGHGEIWYCYGNQQGNLYTVAGVWQRLHPFWNWRRHRQARQVLAL
jgi:hypothetical protein